MNLLLISLFFFSSSFFSFAQKLPEYNCEHEPCENPEEHYAAWFFPQSGTTPCPDCDFTMYVRYTVCPGNPTTVQFEILATTDFDFIGDTNTCDGCDTNPTWKLLHYHKVKRVLWKFAELFPNATLLQYRTNSCWVKLKVGTVEGYPPGIPPPDSVKQYATAPCPGICCEYDFETIKDGQFISVRLLNQNLPQYIECPTKKDIPGLPADCEEICTPYEWWNPKQAIQDFRNAPITIISYPNPANSVINISIQGMGEGDFTFQVYNLNGILMSSQKITSTGDINIVLDINDYSSGYYQYELVQNGLAVQKKGFIVE